jgi:hypothetical protein
MVVAALLTFVAFVIAGGRASAQQVTYYNFNTPGTASPQQYSYTCSAVDTTTNPLFCFNYNFGEFQDPAFLQDPAANGPWATQLTAPIADDGASMWFSVPQKVSQGFTTWFQFKITPSTNYTGDGFAFVIQNSQGASAATNNGIDPSNSCLEVGSGPTVVGTAGQCLGYGGIDNSVALEFDTYQNTWDPQDIPDTTNDNHVAVQSCAPGMPNSPDHLAVSTDSEGTVDCLVSLGATSTLVSNPNSSADGVTPITLADGKVHDVVVVYNGPLDTPANTLSLYIDPAYNPGTHTPVAGSIPIFQGPYNITQAINLMNSGAANDSAYVGFTAGTGGYFESQEIMGWTYTPHTTVQQQQPLAPPGSPTTFDFGTHTYTVTYPSDADTTGVGMGVVANTITPANFAALMGIGPSQYTGSQCQVYDDTGGNCIVYSTYCYNTSTNAVEGCPTGTQTTVCTDQTEPSAGCINLTATYNNSIEPTSPGFLQGDPLYSPITSISGNGSSTTVTCAGECAVTVGQTVSILSANDTPEFTGVTVVTADVNQFTFNNGYNGTSNGGYITSTNVQDIFISYSPESLDGTTAGKTKNFSDFVVLAATVVGSQTSLTVPAGNATENQPVTVTATVSAPSSGPTGLPLLSVSSAGNTLGGTVSFSDNNGPIAGCQNVSLTAITSQDMTTWEAQCSYTPLATGPIPLTAQYSGDAYHQSSSGNQTLNVNAGTVQVAVGTSPAGLNFAVNGTPYSTTQALTWVTGANESLSTTSPQRPTSGTQYVFSSWSNGITNTNALTDVVSAPASPTAYTANFTTQYLLTVTAGSGGTVTAASGSYFNSGSVQTIVAIPASGYTFSGWTGSSDIANPSSATTTVKMNKPETITAVFSGGPAATLSATNIDFGTLYLGSIVTKIVTVTSSGAAPLILHDPFITIDRGGDSSEFITLNLCPSTLAVGKSCWMTVTFIAGPFYNPQTAVLSVNDNAPGSPQTVTLTAQVINPRPQLSASSLSFGTVKTGTPSAAKAVVLTNAGTTPLSITNVAIAGANPGDYSITSNNCPASLAAKSSCTVGVNFKPLAKGTRVGSLLITDNALIGTQDVILTGTGN